MLRALILGIALAVSASLMATPQFAREQALPCSACHAHVPKLNAFGEKFLANGYRVPGAEKKKTHPFALWMSAQSQNSAANPGRYKTIPNRVELIAGGGSDDGRFSYFAEWRVLSRELLGDGTTRDRSGRFEDLFATFQLDEDWSLQVGQFRALSQIDVSRRLNISEPLVFSTSLAGEQDADPRIQSLRGFSLSGRSPGLRASTEADDWTLAATLPFPGEFSIPLTSEAEDTASFEFESDPKGLLFEAYKRDGVNSVGMHGFAGRNDRQLIGLAGQHKVNNLWIEGGIGRASVGGDSEWRYSLGVDWIPRDTFAAGFRLDHRQVAGQDPILLPYVSVLGPFGDQAAKLVIESRLQKDQLPRFVIELGWMF